MFYKLNFLLKTHHNYNLEEINQLMPWERTIYVEQTRSYLKEKNQNNKGYDNL